MNHLGRLKDSLSCKSTFAQCLSGKKTPQNVLRLLNHQCPSSSLECFVMGVAVQPSRITTIRDPNYQVGVLPRIDNRSRAHPVITPRHDDLKEFGTEYSACSHKCRCV